MFQKLNQKFRLKSFLCTALYSLVHNLSQTSCSVPTNTLYILNWLYCTHLYNIYPRLIVLSPCTLSILDWLYCSQLYIIYHRLVVLFQAVHYPFQIGCTLPTCDLIYPPRYTAVHYLSQIGCTLPTCDLIYSPRYTAVHYLSQIGCTLPPCTLSILDWLYCTHLYIIFPGLVLLYPHVNYLSQIGCTLPTCTLSILDWLYCTPLWCTPLQLT